MFSSNTQQNLAPAGAGAPALELGSLVHRAQAEWMIHSDPTTVKLSDIFLHHAATRTIEIKEAYQARVGAPISE